MFLKRSVFKQLIKQAYNQRLKVALRNDGWYYIAGEYWEVCIKDGYIDKETLGDLIALTGELPRQGERFEATPEGNQLEIEWSSDISAAVFTKGPLCITDTLQIGTAGKIQRFLQDYGTGDLFLLNNVFISLVNPKSINLDKGETAPEGPFYHPFEGVLWKNNVCMLRARFRYTDSKNAKIMESLHGVDLIPEED